MADWLTSWSCLKTNDHPSAEQVVESRIVVSGPWWNPSEVYTENRAKDDLRANEPLILLQSSWAVLFQCLPVFCNRLNTYTPKRANITGYLSTGGHCTGGGGVSKYLIRLLQNDCVKRIKILTPHKLFPDPSRLIRTTGTNPVKGLASRQLTTTTGQSDRVS